MAGNRYLADQRGLPFLIHGDTPWSLTHNLTFEEAVRYMTARRAQGFNTLMVSVPDAYDPEGAKRLLAYETLFGTTREHLRRYAAIISDPDVSATGLLHDPAAAAVPGKEEWTST